MDLITTASISLTLLKRLHEISKNVADAEFKNVLADLSSEMADLKLQAAELKERLAALQEENQLLKSTSVAAEEKPIGVKWGCYLFEGEPEKLYCTGCWDSRRKKHLTSRVSTRFRMCPVCKATLG